MPQCKIHRSRLRLGIECALVLAFACGLSVVFSDAASAQSDKIDGQWCRESQNFKIDRENVTTYHGSRVTAEYDTDGLGVRYVAPSNEPEAGTEITIVLRSADMAYLLRRPQGSTGYGERERWQRCKITS